MTREEEVATRLECLRIAVDSTSSDQAVQLAHEFYEFVAGRSTPPSKGH